MKITIFIVVILLMTILTMQGCVHQSEETWRECFTDADCQKVQITCCPCNMGGTESCVPRVLAPLYEENLKRCAPKDQRVCIALENCKIRRCSCVKGKCKER